MKRYLILLLLSLYTNIHCKSIENKQYPKDTTITLIYLLPFGDVTILEIDDLKKVLEKQFDKLIRGTRVFTTLNKTQLPKESYVKARNRYKASIILDYERTFVKGNCVIIGITHEDICANVHNQVDYGIIGISRLNKQVCLVSNRRLTNKHNFWKAILHEYLHTRYSAPHCPNDSNHCIMQDAKGKGNFEIKNQLCNKCKY